MKYGLWTRLCQQCGIDEFKYHISFKVYRHSSCTPNSHIKYMQIRHKLSQNLQCGGFPFNPKFRTFWFGSTGIFGTSFEGEPLWPFWSFRSVGPKSLFPFDKIVVPCTALLHPAYTSNNQTRGGLGRVFNRNVPFHWARGISEIWNRIFCWMESDLRLL